MPDSQSVPLIAPPGYGPVVPFDKARHAGLGLKEPRDYAWCRALNAVYVSAVEFTRAALEYPIAFVREPQHDRFMPVAVLGLARGQNLFVDERGRWRPNHYVPAYFRRHPFCIAELPAAAGAEARQLVCVQEDQLERNARPLLDGQGEPTAEWEPIRTLLEAAEGTRAQTLAFARRLSSEGLLVPFDAVAVPRDGPQVRLAGLHRVDEDRLRKLDARALRGLLSRGELRLVYAHLLSLENFARLLDLSLPGRAGST